MKPEETYFKWCVENGIRIYPVPVSEAHTGNYHIVVEREGKASKGSLIFNEKPIARIVQEMVGSKLVKTTKATPSISQQIHILYKLIYEKECINSGTSAPVVEAK